MTARTIRRSWRDWVLFGAAYGVILGAILFAYPPAQNATHAEAPARQGLAAR